MSALNLHPIQYPRTALEVDTGTALVNVRPLPERPGQSPRYLAEMADGVFFGCASTFSHDELLWTDVGLRLSPAVKRFLQHLAEHDTVRKMPDNAPWPRGRTLARMEGAGLLTARTFDHRKGRRGSAVSSVEFTITAVGRKIAAILAADAAGEEG